MLNKKVRKSLKKTKLSLIVIFLFIGVFLIITSLALGSPYVLPRYRMDIIWLLSIITFIVIGFLYNTVKNKKLLNVAMVILSILMVVISVMLFFVPFDLNWANYNEIFRGKFVYF